MPLDVMLIIQKNKGICQRERHRPSIHCKEPNDCGNTNRPSASAPTPAPAPPGHRPSEFGCGRPKYAQIAKSARGGGVEEESGVGGRGRSCSGCRFVRAGAGRRRRGGTPVCGGGGGWGGGWWSPERHQLAALSRPMRTVGGGEARSHHS